VQHNSLYPLPLVFALPGLISTEKRVKQLFKGNLFMLVPDLPHYARCYSFGSEAMKYLSSKSKALLRTLHVANLTHNSEPDEVPSVHTTFKTLSNDAIVSLLKRLDEI